MVSYTEKTNKQTKQDIDNNYPIHLPYAFPREPSVVSISTGELLRGP